jgi:hypothetical protein
MFYIAFSQNIILPLADPFPLADALIMGDSSRLGYRRLLDGPDSRH